MLSSSRRELSPPISLKVVSGIAVKPSLFDDGWTTLIA